jgi:hypothetical protein
MADDKKEEKKPISAFEYFNLKEEGGRPVGWDKAEIVKDQVIEYKGIYPKPIMRYRIILEDPNKGVEPVYYWCLGAFRDFGFPRVDKILDLFTASETSSLFGASQQRLGLTQDRVMQFLRLIHDMVKGLSVYVRELRAIEERLSYYTKSAKKDAESESAEITLKGLYVDLVEGGTKNPSSVFGLAQQVGFVILPNLFFKMRRYPGESNNDFFERINKLSTEEKGGSFNPEVITLLKRKLEQYYTWKDSSQKEIEHRQRYLLRYFKQYYATIKLYMQWVKPYLRVVQRLGLDLEKNNRAEIVKAFETSMMELEVLAIRADEKSDKVKGPFSCILLTVVNRTKPSMSFATPDYQHRGPIHQGEIELQWRCYSWTKEDIDMYHKLKDEEDFALLGNIDETLKEALSGVEGELADYLAKADAQVFGVKEKVEEPVKSGALDAIFGPVRDAAAGFRDVSSGIVGGTTSVFKSFWPEARGSKGGGATGKIAKKFCWLHYNIFKKAHGLGSW